MTSVGLYFWLLLVFFPLLYMYICYKHTQIQLYINFSLHLSLLGVDHLIAFEANRTLSACPPAGLIISVRRSRHPTLPSSYASIVAALLPFVVLLRLTYVLGRPLIVFEVEFEEKKCWDRGLNPRSSSPQSSVMTTRPRLRPTHSFFCKSIYSGGLNSDHPKTESIQNPNVLKFG